MGDNEFLSGFLAGQGDGGGGNKGGGFFGGDGSWIFAIIILAMVFGGGNMFGNGGGFGGGGGGCYSTPVVVSAPSGNSAIAEGFALNNITGGIRGIERGICDSTFALNNSIMSGFHGVDSALCNLGYQTQQGFSSIGYAIKDCCCETSRAIDGVNFNLAKGLCDVGNMISMQTRDIVENQNANYRGLMDFLVQEKLSAKDAQIAQLQNRVAISDQNAVLGARIDASVAEILRRTGHDCPTAAYLVNAPTPVSFPINSCGQVQFGGNGGCGCGF